MIETILEEAAKQVPALAIFATVLFYIVKHFLKYLAKHDARFENAQQACHTAHANVLKTAGDVAKGCSDTIKENSRALGKVEATLNQVNATLHFVNSEDKEGPRP